MPGAQLRFPRTASTEHNVIPSVEYPAVLFVMQAEASAAAQSGAQESEVI